MKEYETCSHCGQEYDITIEVDGAYLSTCCYSPVAFICPSCTGNRFVEENEYHGDWINYSNRLIMCPECGGEGTVKELTWQ